MKKVILTLVAALLLGFGIGVGLSLHAQNFTLTPGVLPLVSGQVSANCPVPATGQTFYCYAFDKFQISANGAAYVTLFPVPAAGAPSLTLNGTTKTLPNTFNISVAAGAVSAQ